MVSAAARSASDAIGAAALARVADPPRSNSVRVEDYLTALGAITGEAAIVASGGRAGAGGMWNPSSNSRLPTASARSSIAGVDGFHWQVPPTPRTPIVIVIASASYCTIGGRILPTA